MKIEKLEQGSYIKHDYVDKKSCACCVHNILRKCIDVFVDDRYCDIDNHKINYIESFSITCEYQKGKR